EHRHAHLLGPFGRWRGSTNERNACHPRTHEGGRRALTYTRAVSADAVTRARLAKAAPRLAPKDAKAAATCGSSKRAAAPRAGLSRDCSVHALTAGSPDRVISPVIPAWAMCSTSLMSPVNVRGGHRRFFSTSSPSRASTTPTVAALHGTMPIVTYWSVTRSPSKIGRT